MGLHGQHELGTDEVRSQQILVSLSALTFLPFTLAEWMMILYGNETHTGFQLLLLGPYQSHLFWLLCANPDYAWMSSHQDRSLLE